MASYVKFENTVEDILNGVHNFGSDTFKIYLSNAAPDVAADEVKADLAEISAGNGYPAGGATVTVSVSRSGGTAKAAPSGNAVFTASGGTVGPFRYAVLYNDTPTSPADPLIAYWDYGSSITLQATETFTVDLDESGGLFTLG